MQKKLYFKAWNEYVFEKNNFMKAVQAFEGRLSKENLTFCFLFWSDRATRIKNERQLLLKALELKNSRLVANNFRKYFSSYKTKRQKIIVEEEKIRSLRTKVNMHLYAKIINSWKIYHSQKQLKLEKMTKAQELYRNRVFVARFDLWAKNFRHKRWEEKVNLKAEHFFYCSVIKSSFKMWFEQKTDWKEIYFNQRIRPKIFYHLNLTKKVISSWKAFILNARLQNERLKDARVERSKLIMSETLRSWVKYADSMKSFESLRSKFLAKKYGNIWKDKARKQKERLESLRINTRLQESKTTLSTRKLTKNRPAPRMPHFLIEQLKHGASRREPDIPIPVLEDENIVPTITIREFSCQTESIAEKEENFKRKDSAIDVDDADSRIDIDCKNGAQITLEKIAAGLFDYPKNGQVSQISHLTAYPDLDKAKETFHKDPKTVHFMEQKLSEFQDYKKRHQKNLERLRFLQNDIDSVLTSPECSPYLLKRKIKEIESLQKEITVHNQTNDSRKREIIDISQEILYLIQQTR